MTTTSVSLGDTTAHPPATKVGMGRFVRLELRKLVDSRAGRWLSVAVLMLALVVMVIAATTEPPVSAGRSIVSFGSVAVSLLLPVMGILALTSEWSHGSIVTTFVLVPRRFRVVLAKLLALAIASTVATGFVLAAGAGVAAVTRTVRDTPAGVWDLTLRHAALIWVGIVLSMAMGAAFGALFMNPPTAIVAYMGIPLAWSIAVQLVESARDAALWLDTSLTFSWLLDGSISGGTQWQQLGVSVAVWVFLPLALGLLRLSRREVK